MNRRVIFPPTDYFTRDRRPSPTNEGNDMTTDNTNKRDDALLTAIALIEQHNDLQAVSSLLYGQDMDGMTRILASVVSITRHCVREMSELIDVSEGTVLAELRKIHVEHLRGRS